MKIRKRDRWTLTHKIDRDGKKLFMIGYGGIIGTGTNCVVTNEALEQVSMGNSDKVQKAIYIRATTISGSSLKIEIWVLSKPKGGLGVLEGINGQ